MNTTTRHVDLQLNQKSIFSIRYSDSCFPDLVEFCPKDYMEFLERNDLSRKKVVPICTSGNSSITGAEQDLKIIASKTTVWKAGRRFTSSTGVAELKNYFAEVLNFQNTSGTKPLMKSSE